MLCVGRNNVSTNTKHYILYPLAALKKSYVDVFNPSGAAPKNDAPLLAPIMPTMPAQSNMNFFVPAAVPNTNQQNVSKLFHLIYLIYPFIFFQLIQICDYLL